MTNASCTGIAVLESHAFSRPCVARCRNNMGLAEGKGRAEGEGGCLLLTSTAPCDGGIFCGCGQGRAGRVCVCKRGRHSLCRCLCRTKGYTYYMLIYIGIPLGRMEGGPR